MSWLKSFRSKKIVKDPNRASTEVEHIKLNNVVVQLKKKKSE